VWRGNLGTEKNLVPKYEWFYEQGEAGNPVVSILRHAGDSRVVGVAAAGPRRVWWRGRDVLFGVLVDMAVVPEHRSLFPALLLQKSLQKSVSQRLAALYGFPNPRAAPVFARVGYSRILEVGRYVCVLRHAGYLRRKLPRWLAALLAYPLDLFVLARQLPSMRQPAGTAVEWMSAADQRMDELWARAPRGSGPVGVRDAGFLSWRFDRKPGAGIRYLAVTADGAGLLAWFACQADGATLVVSDFWTSGGAERVDPGYLALLLREARRAGYAAVSIEFGGSGGIIAVLRECGFTRRSGRPFFAYLGSETAPPADAWYVTGADEDE
jgi:hypothetical protein